MTPANTLGRKQTIRDQATWQAAAKDARRVWNDTRLDNLIDSTILGIKAKAHHRRVGYGWSGGKDSQVLAWIMHKAGIDQCVLGITRALEYPAMLTWVTEHMPDGLTTIATAHDLPWLRDHPLMLFPQGNYGPRWFQIVQHKVQATYFRHERLDLLALGRRRADGNYIPRGDNVYTNRAGITRWAPLADWPHEAVLALIERERLPLPPCYGWPRGFQVGTGAWPARQWTLSLDHGFEEVWQIDPTVIQHAARLLPQAADWLTRHEADT